MSQILPSLLEYSTEELTRKCNFLQENEQAVLRLTNNKSLHLHLDFVLPQFAKDRSVMASLSVQKVFEVLYSVFGKKPLELTIHLMGENEDMPDIYNLFSKIEIPLQWSSVIFVSPKYHDSWRELLKQYAHVQVGKWLDLNQWQNAKFEAGIHYLLMTVLAGRSGQKRQLLDRQNSIEIARNNSASFFVLDGGWGVDETVHMLNASLVSYSNFWKAVEYK